MDMEPLTKKTTVLLSPELHARLTRLAAQKGTSLGELARSACVREYCAASVEEKIATVRRLAGLQLPVSTVRRMKRESVPGAKGLAP